MTTAKTPSQNFHNLYPEIDPTTPLRLPSPPQAGDVFKVYPGCNKRQDTCKNKFNNIVHFRGFPYIPSADTVV